ncbi:uncharacterized protein LOC142603762 [Balearica regulorum gibbericeps]|uniref:uncharacterized protein LOC142603762 n=1 Tax=Balearica regulorum gibbericeps TaxID=100784 RepID=UPI003F636D7D
MTSLCGVSGLPTPSTLQLLRDPCLTFGRAARSVQGWQCQWRETLSFLPRAGSAQLRHRKGLWNIWKCRTVSSCAWPLWIPTCSVGRVPCSSLPETSPGLSLQFVLSVPPWRYQCWFKQWDTVIGTPRDLQLPPHLSGLALWIKLCEPTVWKLSSLVVPVDAHPFAKGPLPSLCTAWRTPLSPVSRSWDPAVPRAPLTALEFFVYSAWQPACLCPRLQPQPTSGFAVFPAARSFPGCSSSLYKWAEEVEDCCGNVVSGVVRGTWHLSPAGCSRAEDLSTADQAEGEAGRTGADTQPDPAAQPGPGGQPPAAGGSSEADSQSEQEGITQSDLLYLQSRKFRHVTAEFNNLFDKGTFRRVFSWT